MPSNDRFRLLFFGSDAFSIGVLSHLLNKHICPIQVSTKPFSPLDKYSQSRGLIRHNWPHELQLVRPGTFNIGLVASFGNLIDERTVKQFEHGLFNVHPSLLPKYRGSTPIQAAILNRDAVTGCTIMRIPPVAKFDIGDVVIQERVHIRSREYGWQLRDRLADLGGHLAERLLLDFDAQVLNSRPQGDEDKSYAKKIQPQAGQLNFRSEPADLIDRKVRAYTQFIELYMELDLDGDDIRVRLEGMAEPEDVGDPVDLDRFVAEYLQNKGLSSTPPVDCVDESLQADSSSEMPGAGCLLAGTMFFHKTRRLLCIRCSDDRWLAFSHATPEAKARMSAADFYNGYLSRLDPSRRRTRS